MIYGELWIDDWNADGCGAALLGGHPPLGPCRDARRNKAGTNNCIRFGMNREDEICELALSILEQRYVMRPRKNEDDKY